MTRFAWLQSRTQNLVLAGALGVLAVIAAVTGVHVSHVYNTLVGQCRTGCDLALNEFLSKQRFLQHAFDLLALLMPPVLGVFWGAPLLAREFETGTFRLAWTQSVSRSRWLVTKLVFGGLATVVVAGVVTLTVTWWYRAFDKYGTNQYAVFDRRDIAPIGYALFAFATGALIGALVRRTIPAMAGTAIAYVFVRVATFLWVRPHLLSPRHQLLSPLSGKAGAFGLESSNGSPLRLVAHADGPPQSWTLSDHIVNNAGVRPSSGQLAAWMQQYCPKLGLPPRNLPPGHHVARVFGPDGGRACLAQAAKSFHLLVTYQPANRYWAFQWLELGLFLGLALLAAVGCFWWVTRRSN